MRKSQRERIRQCVFSTTQGLAPGQEPGQCSGSVKVTVGIIQLTPPALNPGSSPGDLQIGTQFLPLTADGGRECPSIPVGQLLFLFFSLTVKLAHDFSVCPHTSLVNVSRSP